MGGVVACVCPQGQKKKGRSKKDGCGVEMRRMRPASV